MTATATATATATVSPTATSTVRASLSPDPSNPDRVTFRADGSEWHEFTVSSTERIKVVANPGSVARRVMIYGDDPQRDYCGQVRNEDVRGLLNGQSIYLAGCEQGEGVVELRRAVGDALIQRYEFSINPSAPDITPDACALDALEFSVGRASITAALTDECPAVKRLEIASVAAYGKFYSFRLDSRSKVTITMTALDSTLDTYLYLIEGDDKNGDMLAHNDDIILRLNTNSKIIAEELWDGDYAIEATSYDASAEGAFTLTVQIEDLGPLPDALRVLPGATSVHVKSLSQQAQDVSIIKKVCVGCVAVERSLSARGAHTFSDLDLRTVYVVSTGSGHYAQQYEVQTHSIPVLMAIKDNFLKAAMSPLSPTVSFINGRVSRHTYLLTYTTFRLDTDSSDYRFAMEVPITSGFQLGVNTWQRCVWLHAPSSPITRWQNATPRPKFNLMRCGVGDETTGLIVKAKAATGEEWTYYTFPHKQSWHRKNSSVKYTVEATTSVISDTLPSSVTTAVNAWNASSAVVNFCQGSGCGSDYSDSRDGKVTIKVSSSGGCRNGIACVSPGFWYPHKTVTTLTIEQPASTSTGKNITWTNMIEETTPTMFYLPGVVMHEFGHTTGIGHNSNRQVGGVMVHKAIFMDALADYDVQVMRVSIAGIQSHD